MGILEFIAENYIMLLAIYGSILSTIGIIWNIYRTRLDNARIKVKTSIGFFSGSSQDGKIFFFIQAINFGRRPINLSSVGIRLSDSRNILMTNISLPIKLGEGESHDEFIEVEKLRKVVCEFAWYKDETGKLYKSKNIKQKLYNYFNPDKKRKKNSSMDIVALE